MVRSLLKKLLTTDNNKLYCFTYFPNGLSKVLVTCLHLENITLSGYIDDFFTKNRNFK